MAPPRICGDNIKLQLTPHLKDERLSWPSWLTYSGQFTHISGHPSAVGRAQDSESSPVKDQDSTAETRNPSSPLDDYAFGERRNNAPQRGLEALAIFSDVNCNMCAKS